MKLLVIIAIFQFSVAYGANNEKALSINCNAANYSELVRCAESSSADIHVSRQKNKAAEKLEDAAGQWINPELAVESISKGSDRIEQSATLFFNFSLGGKRNARMTEAKAQYDRESTNSNLEIQNYRLSLMLAFYRLRHLQSEIDIEQESVATFSKIINQYQKKAALSPEQDVSLSIFKMALNDHQLGLSDLKSEFEKLLQEVNSVTNIAREVILKNLPVALVSWPKIDPDVKNNESPQIKLAQADLNLARSLKKQAVADSWPELKIGPTVQVNKENNESENLQGFSLSMPLPVFSWNGGSRDYATQKVSEAEMNYNNTRNKISAHRSQLVTRYLNMTAALKTSLSTKTLAEKHSKVEKQFFKGLVPSSLIIEAHRQLFDLESRKNKSEIEALESLGQVLILDNKFSEVIL